MKQLNEIKSVVKDELDAFNASFSEVIKTRVPLLNVITKYMMRSKGKQMRPLFTFLTAGMIGERIPEAPLRGL